MDKYVVKIESEYGVSTGFIHFPENKDDAYVICSIHGIADSETLDLAEEIKIEFFDESKAVYMMTEIDSIVKGRSNKEDIAVLIFSRDNVPMEITQQDLPQLIKLTGVESRANVKGLPNAADNERIRTLYRGTIISEKDFASQVQLEVTDPLTEHPDADQLVEGYSGSPLILQLNDVAYCFGIFTDFEAELKRVLGVTLVALDDLLIQSGRPSLELQEIETDESVLKSIDKIRQASSRVLGRARSKIGNQHLERDDVVKAISSSIESKTVTMISGVAGIGKSAAARIVLDQMKDRFEIIALQGEQLDKQNVDSIFSDPSIGINHLLNTLLNSRAMKREKIILLDSLEKIVETANADAVKDFFALLLSRTDLKIVLTCRTYASEYLQVRYLREFPPVSIFEMPLLSDNEFQEILNLYPAIAEISVHQSVNKILRIPFNLDKATLLSATKIKAVGTETAFKQLVWDYVIENRENEPNADMREQRGLVLEQLAVERANQMTSFAVLPLDRNPIINKLLGDGILEQATDSTKGYAIAHDIYEDWALLRFIAKQFSKTYPIGSIESFFDAIGYRPSIRRAYKMWLTEHLTAGDQDAKYFILRVLRTLNIKYWKDETLLAIIQTSHFVTFIKEFQEVFFESDNAVLKRCILLLNIACQRPNFELLEALPADRRRTAYSNAYLVPIGASWGTLLEFISVSVEQLTNEFDVILPVIQQWEKGLQYFKPLPQESRYVGTIILAYFEKYKQDLAAGRYSNNRDNLPDMVSLLFRLTELFKDDVSRLLQEAIAFKRDDNNYRLDSFHSEIIDKTLSLFEGMEVSHHLPTLVVEAARREWFYIPPTPEELAALYQKVPFFPRGGGIHEHNENTFGVSSELRRDGSTASALKTPVYNLLQYHTQLGIRFIVELFNHSVGAYWRSDFLTKESEFMGIDPRVKVTYQVDNDTIITQNGSSTLWMMYRGGRVATPNLLQSVLQALEKYMLELADIANKDTDNKFPNVRNVLFGMTRELLIRSRSVSTTAVVVSVGTAYYSLMADHILPLLRVKEFYFWDRSRFSHERYVLNLIGSQYHARTIWEENNRSNQLPHRQQTLRYVVMNLSLSSHREQIESILDNFYSLNDPDENWRFMLNAMDYRKLRVVEKVENGVVVEPALDPDLQEIADRNEPQQRELEELQKACHWALQKFKDNGSRCAPNEFETWQGHFNTTFRNNITHPHAKLFNHPALLGFLGLRDFHSRLTNEQLDKSISRVFSLIDRDLKRSKNPYDLDMDSPFTTIERDAAYQALVEIILSTSGQTQARSKELCLWSILLLNKDLEKEKLLENLKQRLPELASLYVGSITEYARAYSIQSKIQRIAQFNNWLPPRGYGGLLTIVHTLATQGWQHSKAGWRAWRLLRAEKKIVDRIIQKFRSGNSKSFLDEDLNNIASSHFLILGLNIIRPDTNDPSLIGFVQWMLRYIFAHIDTESKWGHEKIHFEQLQQCEKMFAEFILEQSPDISTSFFDVLIEGYLTSQAHSRKHFDFVNRTLNEMMSICKAQHVDRFWFLWKRAYGKFSASGDRRLMGTIMLDYQFWFPVKTDWAPIKNKSEFFEKITTNEKSLVKETAKLLAGLGFPELLPQGINWLWKQVQENGIDGKDEFNYTENLLTAVFYDHRLRMMVQGNQILRDSYIGLLERLIEKSSPSAYLIREDVISFITPQ